MKKWKHESEEYIRTFLLSATLSDDVVDTLFALFGSNGKKMFRFVAMHFARSHDSISTLQSLEKNRLIRLSRPSKLLPKPMVVYVLEPREAKEIAKKLGEFWITKTFPFSLEKPRK